MIIGAVQKMSYDVFNDFEPVAMIASNPQIIVTNPSTRETESEFQISQVTDVISTVTWRRFSGGLFRGAMSRDEPISSRSRTDRCANPI